jgi:DNA-binding NtrC family response regulator
MVEIWKMVGKLSATDATVLIQGESGTGKELLARSIFSNSLRKDKPFLAVNCAALPETLLESELFGHEKGSFTDAVSRHIGRFEQCAGGTIFLDEISEISLKNQAKLLRVLENQEFERVGGNENIKADVRIIAASNRSLIQAVKGKSFRMDLFYRLKVVTIHLPLLRERPEDIPLLVDFFVKKFARENRKALMNVSPSAMKLLLSYPWTGNIRELKNIINSAIVFSRGNTLSSEDFEPLLFGSKNSGVEDTSSLSTPDFPAPFKSLFDNLSRDNEGAVYERFIAEAEKTLFRLAMEKNMNNEVHAAKFLGISRNTLRQRLKLHKLT